MKHKLPAISDFKEVQVIVHDHRQYELLQLKKYTRNKKKNQNNFKMEVLQWCLVLFPQYIYKQKISSIIAPPITALPKVSSQKQPFLMYRKHSTPG